LKKKSRQVIWLATLGLYTVYILYSEHINFKLCKFLLFFVTRASPFYKFVISEGFTSISSRTKNWQYFMTNMLLFQRTKPLITLYFHLKSYYNNGLIDWNKVWLSALMNLLYNIYVLPPGAIWVSSTGILTDNFNGGGFKNRLQQGEITTMY
jgi:hypothetical protein